MVKTSLNIFHPNHNWRLATLSYIGERNWQCCVSRRVQSRTSYSCLNHFWAHHVFSVPLQGVCCRYSDFKNFQVNQGWFLNFKMEYPCYAVLSHHIMLSLGTMRRHLLLLLLFLHHVEGINKLLGDAEVGRLLMRNFPNSTHVAPDTFPRHSHHFKRLRWFTLHFPNLPCRSDRGQYT